MFDILGLCNCISTTASLLAQFVYLVFRTSHSVGHLIVNFAYACTVGICSVFETVVLVFKVLYEDYCIFVADLVNRVATLVNDVGYLLGQLVFGLHTCWSCLKGSLLLVYQSIELCISTSFSVVAKIVNVVITVPELIKHALIIIGSSIWYMLWFLPFSILYSLTLIVYFAGRGYEELYTLTFTVIQGIFQTITNCVVTFVDFPLEALFGLCAGALLGFGFYKYSSQIAYYGVYCFGYARQQIRQLPVQIWNGLLLFMLELFSRFRTGQNANIQNISSSDDSFDDTPVNPRPRPVLRSNTRKQSKGGQKSLHRQLSSDQESNLCVVCQDAEKCMVIFPCRHVCLCKLCCLTIQRGPRECPVCRAPMSSTFSVFL